MDATADGFERPCDNLPHLDQFIEQSGPAQPILAELLKSRQPRSETRNDPQE
jgi:hypothetical protein